MLSSRINLPARFTLPIDESVSANRTERARTSSDESALTAPEIFTPPPIFEVAPSTVVLVSDPVARIVSLFVGVETLLIVPSILILLV